MAKQRKYGIDRVLIRFQKDDQITLPVSGKTMKAWRRDDPHTALAKLIKKTGGQGKLAERIGVSQKTISAWLLSDIPMDTRPVRPPNDVEVSVEKAGGQPKVASLLGVTQQCVSRWCRAGFMPPSRAQEMEMHSGVPRAKLISPKLRNAMGAGGEL